MTGIPLGDLGAEFGPEATPFDAIGGEEAVRDLVDAFYDYMDADPVASTIRAMHVELSVSRNKLFWFLCGWLGGPPHYVERFGHPRLRQRHAAFSIDPEARGAWMTCMQSAMDDRQINGVLRQFLDARFEHLASFMINR